MNPKTLLMLLCITFLSCEEDDLIVDPIAVPQQSTIVGCTDPFSFNYNPQATQNGESCNSMGNCYSYIGGATNSGNIGVSLGNPVWDQRMGQEVYLQSQFFTGIPASVYILYEGALQYKNAYASPNGQILFGYYMFYYTVQTYGELPVAGILAHEWGHRAQQTIGWNEYYRPEHKELEADAFSGYYMALRKQYAWSQIQGYFANVYATGNYLFNDPDFHGTPDQRLQAAYLGVNVGVYALQNNIQYTYNDLHSIFFSQISSSIAPRTTHNQNQKEFKEVVYPSHLTEDYIVSLFPKR